MNMSWWLNILISCAIVIMGVGGCAKSERAISGTEQFIRKHVNISDRESWSPEDPQFWQMWQDEQGGG